MTSFVSHVSDFVFTNLSTTSLMLFFHAREGPDHHQSSHWTLGNLGFVGVAIVAMPISSKLGMVRKLLTTMKLLCQFLMNATCHFGVVATRLPPLSQTSSHMRSRFTGWSRLGSSDAGDALVGF